MRCKSVRMKERERDKGHPYLQKFYKHHQLSYSPLQSPVSNQILKHTCTLYIHLASLRSLILQKWYTVLQCVDLLIQLQDTFIWSMNYMYHTHTKYMVIWWVDLYICISYFRTCGIKCGFYRELISQRVNFWKSFIVAFTKPHRVLW